MTATEPEEPIDPADQLKFLCLGGGNEVGRSCHIIQYKGKTVMVSTPPPCSLCLVCHCTSEGDVDLEQWADSLPFFLA